VGDLGSVTLKEMGKSKPNPQNPKNVEGGGGGFGETTDTMPSIDNPLKRGKGKKLDRVVQQEI